MHIGIDARLPAFRAGGISEYVVELIRALARVDTDDRFTIFHARHDRTSRCPTDARHMTRADLSTPCHHPFERMLLATELKPFALDVFHSPDFIPPAFGATRRVITVHDLGFLEMPRHLSDAAHRHYAGQIDWAVAQADVVIADSATVRDDIRLRFPAAAPKVVGVPLAAASRYHAEHDPAQVAATLSRHGLRPGFVLFVGTIEPRKNLATLLEAFRRLPAHAAAPSLVLAGERGWLCDGVMAAVEEQGIDVRWLGRVSEADLPHLYAGAGVLALPSFTEGFGLPVLEAMQSGCPVIASTGGALQETAGGAALLVDPRDVDGWASALSSVLSDRPLSAQLQARGLARAREFCWRATATRTMALYQGM